MPRRQPAKRDTAQLAFGTAGIPHSTIRPTVQSGIIRVHQIGLGGMEVKFLEGVRMNRKTAGDVGEVARKRGIRLTAHGPYFINLNAKEAEKTAASRERILQTARIAHAFGGEAITFHAAFYMKMPAEQVYNTVKRHLCEIVAQLESENITIPVRPEVMGKPDQFGTLNEILRLSAEIEGVAPCIDFAHLHGRTGRFNTYNEFSQVLEQVGEKLGRKELDNMHIHISGINYGGKGEKNHVNLPDSDFRYLELIQALKDHEVKGIVICESPNLEDDALLLQGVYQTSA